MKSAAASEVLIGIAALVSLFSSLAPAVYRLGNEKDGDDQNP
jgi:hypothetical protein